MISIDASNIYHTVIFFDHTSVSHKWRVSYYIYIIIKIRFNLAVLCWLAEVSHEKLTSMWWLPWWLDAVPFHAICCRQYQLDVLIMSFFVFFWNCHFHNIHINSIHCKFALPAALHLIWIMHYSRKNVLTCYSITIIPYSFGCQHSESKFGCPTYSNIFVVFSRQKPRVLHHWL